MHWWSGRCNQDNGFNPLFIRQEWIHSGACYGNAQTRAVNLMTSAAPLIALRYPSNGVIDLSECIEVIGHLRQCARKAVSEDGAGDKAGLIAFLLETRSLSDKLHEKNRPGFHDSYPGYLKYNGKYKRSRWHRWFPSNKSTFMNRSQKLVHVLLYFVLGYSRHYSFCCAFLEGTLALCQGQGGLPSFLQRQSSLTGSLLMIFEVTLFFVDNVSRRHHMLDTV